MSSRTDFLALVSGSPLIPLMRSSTSQLTPSAPKISTSSQILTGTIAQVGTPARFIAIYPTSSVRDGSNLAFKPKQVAGASATLSLFPYYFNAPDSMFSGKTKKKGTASFTISQTAPEGSNPSALSWSHTSYIIDPSLMANSVGDQLVQSIQLGGLTINTLQHIPISNGSAFFSCDLHFLLDAHPYWERHVDVILQRANIAINTPLANATAKYFAIPAASAAALQVANEALSLIDIASGGDADKIEQLIGYANSTATALNVSTTAAFLGAPNAVQVPAGFQTWALIPDIIGDAFILACANSGLTTNASGQLQAANGNKATTALINSFPYILLATQVS